MKCPCFLLTVGLIAVLTASAPAGIFFGKHTKPSPAERVSQLLITMETDTDDGNRPARPRNYGNSILGLFRRSFLCLIDVLKHDSKASVRVEAAQTLGKLRPVSQGAGMALEEAVADPSWRVRWQARQSLRGYHLSGYRSPPKPELASPASGKQSLPLLPGSGAKREASSAAPRADRPSYSKKHRRRRWPIHYLPRRHREEHR